MKKFALVLMGITLFSGCGRETSSDEADSEYFEEDSDDYPGVIMRMQEITIKDDEETAMQYSVQLDNGELRTIVQELEPRLYVGQKVFVLISPEGYSRVVPRET